MAALTRAVGFVPERRAFRPHVTVGRFPRDARVRAKALGESDEPPELIFGVPSLGLYRSHTGGRAGAQYEALAVVDLMGHADTVAGRETRHDQSSG